MSSHEFEVTIKPVLMTIANFLVYIFTFFSQEVVLMISEDLVILSSIFSSMTKLFSFVLVVFTIRYYIVATKKIKKE